MATSSQSKARAGFIAQFDAIKSISRSFTKRHLDVFARVNLDAFGLALWGSVIQDGRICKLRESADTLRAAKMSGKSILLARDGRSHVFAWYVSLDAKREVYARQHAGKDDIGKYACEVRGFVKGSFDWYALVDRAEDISKAMRGYSMDRGCAKLFGLKTDGTLMEKETKTGKTQR